MLKNAKQYIERVIALRTNKGDPPKFYALRPKSSHIWGDFAPYHSGALAPLYTKPFDGLKLKFNNVTLTFNADGQRNIRSPSR